MITTFSFAKSCGSHVRRACPPCCLAGCPWGTSAQLRPGYCQSGQQTELEGIGRWAPELRGARPPRGWCQSPDVAAWSSAATCRAWADFCPAAVLQIWTQICTAGLRKRPCFFVPKYAALAGSVARVGNLPGGVLQQQTPTCRRRRCWRVIKIIYKHLRRGNNNLIYINLLLLLVHS